jgi:hypothetical protein
LQKNRVLLANEGTKKRVISPKGTRIRYRLGQGFRMKILAGISDQFEKNGQVQVQSGKKAPSALPIIQAF